MRRPERRNDENYAYGYVIGLDPYAALAAKVLQAVEKVMSMPARIYQNPKNAMQSGKAKTHIWVLEFEPAEAKKPDPLTGWAGSGDTQQQVRLTFPSQEAASAYAEKYGIEAMVKPTPEKRLKLQAYADNFG
jgi:hypothetical protein